MDQNIPAYIKNRIRQATPLHHHVVSSSTPVVAFGDVRKATIATLGLNPSRSEFQDRQGNLLSNNRQRLETLSSLDITSLIDASDDHISKIFERCNMYFTHNPYWTWFGQLEIILNALNTSYKDGSACHLDLVQWATDPVWAKIPTQIIREQLIQSDAAFLRQQLQSEKIRVLLLNGKSVINAFSQTQKIKLRELPEMLRHRSAKTQIFVGTGFQDITIIGWTINIQSSFGVSTEFKQMLAQRVAEIVESR
ncbi:hypothetical protein F8S13_24190 [Chloroflexia bacterium SDU3-3]|nr:hypothetical protein F8S13_24190 [Chloroflexia bacterium SDU3-3]